MKNLCKFLMLCLPLVAVQACSSPKTNETEKPNVNSNSSSLFPKEFGDRFSSNKIKKEREAFYAQKRQELKRSNPTLDANNAIRTGNIYLMEVAGGRGGSRTIPGLFEPKIDQINCRTESVQGMGDVVYGQHHMSYRIELLEYMREFNSLISPYCK